MMLAHTRHNIRNTGYSSKESFPTHPSKEPSYPTFNMRVTASRLKSNTPTSAINDVGNLTINTMSQTFLITLIDPLGEAGGGQAVMNLGAFQLDFRQDIGREYLPGLILDQGKYAGE